MRCLGISAEAIVASFVAFTFKNGGQKRRLAIPSSTMYSTASEERGISGPPPSPPLSFSFEIKGSGGGTRFEKSEAFPSLFFVSVRKYKTSRNPLRRHPRERQNLPYQNISKQRKETAIFNP